MSIVNSKGIIAHISIRYNFQTHDTEYSRMHLVPPGKSQYMSQCWPKFMSPCGVTRPQRVRNIVFGWFCNSTRTVIINTLRPGQDGRNFPDDIFKWIFLNENIWILIQISLKFVPMGPITNIPALVLIMAWRRPGDKPLSEPMIVSLLTHICVARPQWVKETYV